MGETFSYSRLETFRTCPRSYYYNYVLKQRSGDNIYSFLGTIVHDAIEKMDNDLITSEQGLNLFLEGVEDANVLGLEWISENVKNKFVDSIAHYFRNYHKPSIKEIHTEEHFIVGIGMVDIQGYIDKWFWDGNTIHIEDYKTSTKYSKADFEQHKWQLAIYAKALSEKYPDTPMELSFNMLKYANVNGKLIDRTKLDDIGEYHDGLITIPYTKTLADGVKQHVTDTVSAIRAIEIGYPYMWKKGKNPRNDFFCKHLCTHRPKCMKE